jgi:hypothetical protein
MTSPNSENKIAPDEPSLPPPSRTSTKLHMNGIFPLMNLIFCYFFLRSQLC